MSIKNFFLNSRISHFSKKFFCPFNLFFAPPKKFHLTDFFSEIPAKADILFFDRALKKFAIELKFDIFISYSMAHFLTIRSTL